MKTCPICKARCFDDMEICYGCMHRFADDELMSSGYVGGGDGEPHAALDEIPEGPSAETAQDKPASELSRRKRSSSRKEAPQVFGVVDDAARERGYLDSPGSLYCNPSGGYCASPVTPEPSLVMLTVGPIASASLGNGFRLVVGIERE